MSYPDLTDNIKQQDFADDLLQRKEFYQYHEDEDRDFRNPAGETSDSNWLKIASHQQFVANFMNPDTPYKRLLIKWATGSGKCFGVNTPVMRYDGSTVMVQDVCAGDVLMGDDSTPRVVSSVCRGMEQMYKVVPQYGRPFVCNLSHILCCIVGPDKVSIEVRDYLAKSQSWKNRCMMYRAVVDFAPTITPYDSYDIGWSYIAEYDFISNKMASRGLPHVFKCNDVITRRQLIAGVFDACASDTNELLVPQEELRNDIVFVLRSLGLGADVAGEYICVSGDVSTIPARTLSGWLVLPNHQQKTHFKVIPLGIDHYYGFVINGNRKFLLDDFTVVHNTIGAISIARKFITVYDKIYRNLILTTGSNRKAYSDADRNTPSVYIIGFTRANIIRELLKYPELGFVTIQERDELTRLQSIAAKGTAVDVKRLRDYQNMLRRRVTNKSKGGFYKFFGYQEFVNRLFLSDTVNLTSLESMVMNNPEGGTLEEIVSKYISSGKIQINTKLMQQMENSLIICDEMHNTYNSVMKNNYGVAIQYVLDTHPNVRAVFLSATVMNNSPTEIVDVLNYLVPVENKVVKRDLFTRGKTLAPDALDKIAKLSFGRVSFLQDMSPKYYPELIIEGAERKLRHPVGTHTSIPYLKFIPCPMGEVQLHTYKNFIANAADKSKRPVIPMDSYALYDTVFPSPDDDTMGIFTTADVRTKIRPATAKWLNKNKVSLTTTQSGATLVGGEWLHADNVGKYSGKLKALGDIIAAAFDKRLKNIKKHPDVAPYTFGEKMMIYHERVKLNGVMFIQEFLRANNIIDEFSEPVDNTRCSTCGGFMRAHAKFIRVNKIPDHMFYPARFVIAHSEIDKNSLHNSMEMFKNPDNAYGNQAMILLGSKLIRESYDLKDIRHMYVLSMPVDISGLIQLIGRMVRRNSHITLPPEKRTAHLHILLTTIPDREKSIDTVFPEEYRYVDKLVDYIAIQRIDKVLNANAIDAPVHRNIVMSPALMKKYFPSGDMSMEPAVSLGNLYFDHVVKLPRGYSLDKLTLDTFSPFGNHVEEIRTLTYIIKRLFIITRVWQYDTLWSQVREPPFGIESNPKLFAESNFAIALNNLVESSQSYVDKALESELFEHPDITERMLVSMLFDKDEKYIYINATKHKIEHVGAFYILFPVINSEDRNVFNNHRAGNQTPSVVVIKDVESFSRPVQKINNVRLNLDAWLKESKTEYNYDVRKQAFIDKYSDSDVELDTFIGEYDSGFYERLFKDIVEWEINEGDDHLEELYSSIIDIMDQFGAIVYIEDVLKYKETAKKFNNNKVIRMRGGKPYSDYLDSTVVGFISNQSVLLYDKPNWITVNKISMNIRTQFTENNTYIGYFELSNAGQMKFKIRNPVHQIKKNAERNPSDNADTRILERGIVCVTKSKPELLKIAKMLNIKTHSNKKMKIRTICEEIRSRLLQLEMKERQKNSKIKYVYMWYEDQPALSL